MWAWTPKVEWAGKTKFKDRTVEDLKSIAKRFKMKRQDQPAPSPDLNTDDFYIWRVLDPGVHKR